MISDSTWTQFRTVDAKLISWASRWAQGDKRLLHRLHDAGRERLLECLTGKEIPNTQPVHGPPLPPTRCDIYDEAKGPLITYAFPRILTTFRNTLRRTLGESSLDDLSEEKMPLYHTP